MSKIFYNGVDVFSPQPAPLISRGLEYITRGDGRKLSTAERYTLVGQITGCSFETITGAQALITSGFSTDFKDLNFIDTNFTGVISGCKILSINYEQGKWIGVLPYTIEILSYRSDFFESAGIIDKKNSWSVSQDESQNLSITHDIFAKGVNSSPQYNNALTNAKNFVLGLTGFNPPTLFPFFISGFSGSLDTRTETINRLDATYQIIENYVGRTGSAISQETTINLVSGEDGIITAEVNGSFKGGKNDSMDTVRSAYSGFDAYSYTTGTYINYRGATGLVALPLSSGVSENIRENSINFSISFNDYPEVSYRHSRDVQISSGQDGTITSSINGDIQGLGRQKLGRYDNAYRFFTGLNIFSLVNQEYNNYVGTGYNYSLNSFPLTSGVNTDRFAGRITYNVSFSDKPLGLSCSGVKQFDYSIRKEYAMRQLRFGLVPYAISGGCIQDLNYASRSSISVNGNVITNPSVLNAKSAAQQFVNNKFRLTYMQNRDNLLLDSASISENIDLSNASFDYAISFDEAPPINADVSYTFITGLKI